MSENAKLIDMTQDVRFKGAKIRNKDEGGGGGMDKENYVTHRELELTKEAIETKIDLVGNKIENSNENITRIDKKINAIIGLGISSVIIPILIEIIKRLF